MPNSLAFIGEVFLQDTLVCPKQPHGTAPRLKAFAEEIGGSAFNSASVSGQLGARARLVVPHQARDASRIQRACALRNVIFSNILKTAHPTPRIWILVVGRNHNVYFGEDPMHESTSWPDDLASRLQADVIALQGGRYRSTRSAFAEIAHSVSGRVAFNPSHNVRLYSRRQLARIVSSTWLLQTTTDEFGFIAELLGVESPEDLIGIAPQLVVVTKGSAGATIYRSGEKVQATHVAPQRVAEINHVGAGDAFFGALLTRLAQNQPIPEAGHTAARVGAMVAGSAEVAPLFGDRLR